VKRPSAEWDWWELLLWRFIEAELEHLTPEEERALWQYAEGERIRKRERLLAEQAIQKIRQRLNLEPENP
jgi:hypothetical protein